MEGERFLVKNSQENIKISSSFSVLSNNGPVLQKSEEEIEAERMLSFVSVASYFMFSVRGEESNDRLSFSSNSSESILEDNTQSSSFETAIFGGGNGYLTTAISSSSYFLYSASKNSSYCNFPSDGFKQQQLSTFSRGDQREDHLFTGVEDDTLTNLRNRLNDDKNDNSSFGSDFSGERIKTAILNSIKERDIKKIQEINEEEKQKKEDFFTKTPLSSVSLESCLETKEKEGDKNKQEKEKIREKVININNEKSVIFFTLTVVIFSVFFLILLSFFLFPKFSYRFFRRKKKSALGHYFSFFSKKVKKKKKISFVLKSVFPAFKTYICFIKLCCLSFCFFVLIKGYLLSFKTWGLYLW